MGTHNHNYRLVKIHRTYTIEEVASLLGVHRNSVRRWLEEGLSPIDKRRPLLIHGTVLVAFLKGQRAKKKRPCAPGQIYCLRCREPKTPAGSKVLYDALTFNRGNLVGSCPDCGLQLFRRTSLAKLAAAMGDLHVTFPHAPGDIVESPDLSPNGYFEQAGQNRG